MRAWKMKAVENIAYFGLMVNGALRDSEKEDFQPGKAMAGKVLQKLTGYRVQWEKDENRNHVDGMVRHLVWLDV